MRQRSILLEALARRYDDDWSSSGEVDLWLGTVNFPIPEEVERRYMATGNHALLRHAIGGGDRALAMETQWHAETIGANCGQETAFRLATTAFSPLDATKPRPGGDHLNTGVV